MEREKERRKGRKGGEGGRKGMVVGWRARREGEIELHNSNMTMYDHLLSHLLGSCTLSVFGRRSHDNVLLPMDLGTHPGSSSGLSG